MSKIYTKSGDDGTTGLFGSTHIRLPKYHLRVDTYGNIDELNSFIGLLRSNIKTELLKSDEFREHYDFLFIIQNKLFVLIVIKSLQQELIVKLEEVQYSGVLLYFFYFGLYFGYHW